MSPKTLIKTVNYAFLTFIPSFQDFNQLCSSKYLAYGKTNGGRFLLVVWAAKYRKTKIITARDMSKKEKQFYKRRKK